MATYVSGNGGYIEVRAAGSSGSYTRYDNTKWVLRTTDRLTENTHSGTTSTNFEAVVPHNEWNAEVPLDLLNVPSEGTLGDSKVDVIFHVGESALFYDLRATSNEVGEITNDNAQDIARVACSGKGGYLA